MAKYDEADPYFPDDPFGLTQASDGSLQANLSETQAEPVWEGLPLTDAAPTRARTQPTPAPAQAKQTGAMNPAQSASGASGQTYAPTQQPPTQTQQWLYQSYPGQPAPQQPSPQLAQQQPFYGSRQSYPGVSVKRKRWGKVIVPLAVIGVFLFGRGMMETVNSVGYEDQHLEYTSLDASAPVNLNLDFLDSEETTIQAAFVSSPDGEWYPYLVTSYQALTGSYSTSLDEGLAVTLAGFDITNDIAVLEIHEGGTDLEIRYPDSDISNTAISVGQVLADGPSIEKTTVTKLGSAELDLAADGVIALDSALSLDEEFPRGSVLVDADGGYPVAIVVGNETSNVAVPLTDLDETVERVMARTSASKTVQLGRPSTLGLDLEAKTANTDGALVVSADWPATAAGIAEGDYLVSINDVALKNGQVADDVIRMLRAKSEAKLVWIGAEGVQKTALVTVERSDVN